MGRPGFQAWAAKSALTRSKAGREGAELFDLVSGFVNSQVLLALIELNLLEVARDRPADPDALATETGIDPQRMAALLQAGAALGLYKRTRRGRYVLSRKGAALIGVPGLVQMIRHHGAFYRNLEDPVKLLKGAGPTELAQLWPYVFGEGSAGDPEVAATYSELMAQSQALVAQETLMAVSLKEAEHILDVGGGTGTFLAAAARRAPKAKLTLFDLPAVTDGARSRLEAEGLAGRVKIVSGSFREDPLPEGADRISLVRVLYDHSDETVRALLHKVYGALHPGGWVIISEPMSGGRVPERAGDVYFAFYTMAMGTGRARSAEEIGAMLTEAGFERVRRPSTSRPYVTSVVVARKPVIEG